MGVQDCKEAGVIKDYPGAQLGLTGERHPQAVEQKSLCHADDVRWNIPEAGFRHITGYFLSETHEMFHDAPVL